MKPTVLETKIEPHITEPSDKKLKEINRLGDSNLENQKKKTEMEHKNKSSGKKKRRTKSNHSDKKDPSERHNDLVAGKD